MKIVEIISQLNSGGAERFTVDLCNELSKEHDVTLIVLYSLEMHGFYASEVSKRVNLVSLNMTKKSDIGIYFRVRSQIKKIKPDIVHTHLNALPCTMLPILFSRKIGYFHTVHNDARKEAKDAISAAIRRLCFKRKLVTPITISKESQRSFVDYYGLDAPMIFNGRDIPMDLDVSQAVKEEFKQYRKTKDTKVLVCLARIMHVKRQPMLVKIADRLNKEGYNFTLLLIGNKRNEEMVAEIESYNCKNVYLLGEKHNPLEYLAMTDAYCLCSSYEGMPISLIEAMGVGAIPVCTPVGGIVDVICNGINGFISKDIEQESYYETLKTFLTLSAEDLVKVSFQTKMSYTPFSMKECASKYVELFKKK